MPFCNQCGSQVPEEVSFCTECGAPMDAKENAREKREAEYSGQPASYPPQQTYAPAQPYQQPYVQTQAITGVNTGYGAQPAYVPQPGYGPAASKAPKARKDGINAMGVGAYLGTLLLMMIPLVGFILTIVWACGGTSNLNKRNLARAYLILMLIMLVISACFYFAVRGLIGSALAELELLSGYGGFFQEDGLESNVPMMNDNDDYGVHSSDQSGSNLEEDSPGAEGNELDYLEDIQATSEDMKALQDLLNALNGLQNE